MTNDQFFLFLIGFSYNNTCKILIVPNKDPVLGYVLSQRLTASGLHPARCLGSGGSVLPAAAGATGGEGMWL